MLKKLLLLPLIVLSLQAADFPLAMTNKITDERKSAFIMNVLAPEECGEIKFSRHESGFSLSIDNEEQDIPNYMVSKPLRQMKPEQLAGFLQSNYLTLTQCSNGEFSLEEHGRLHGGGPGGGAAGWLGGYVAGEVAGYAVIMFSGYVALYATKKVVGKYAGPAAEEEFARKMQERLIPSLQIAAERVAHGSGVVGGVTGGLFGTASPTP